MHNTQIPPTNLLFDQKEDLEPSTQTAVADDRRFKWNNLEAALMLFSCSFRSELENFSPTLVTSSFTKKQIQSSKRSSLKYFCSQKCKLSKKRQRTMTPNCKTKNTERERMLLTYNKTSSQKLIFVLAQVKLGGGEANWSVLPQKMKQCKMLETRRKLLD